MCTEFFYLEKAGRVVEGTTPHVSATEYTEKQYSGHALDEAVGMWGFPKIRGTVLGSL